MEVLCDNSWEKTLFNDFLNSLVALLKFKGLYEDSVYVGGASAYAFNSYWTFGTNNCSDFLLMGEAVIIKTLNNIGAVFQVLRR